MGIHRSRQHAACTTVLFWLIIASSVATTIGVPQFSDLRWVQLIDGTDDVEELSAIIHAVQGRIRTLLADSKDSEEADDKLLLADEADDEISASQRHLGSGGHSPSNSSASSSSHGGSSSSSSHGGHHQWWDEEYEYKHVESWCMIFLLLLEIMFDHAYQRVENLVYRNCCDLESQGIRNRSWFGIATEIEARIGQPESQGNCKFGSTCDLSLVLGSKFVGGS